MDVTQVTKNAAIDTYTDTDYREMLDENWPLDEGGKRISLDKLMARIESSVNKAMWWKWQKGEGNLTRSMKNDLRRLVGLAELPPTVEAIAQALDPNIEVSQVGIPTHMLLIPDDVIVSTAGGKVTAMTIGESVTTVTGSTTKKVRVNQHRPWIKKEYRKVMDELGVSWEQVFEAGLQEFLRSRDKL